MPVETALFVDLLALVLAGLVAERLARWLRVPDIVLFLLAGVLLGPVGGIVRLGANGGLVGFVLVFGAVFMLYEGGRRLSLDVLREIWLGLLLLASVGVLLTVVVVAASAHLILRMPWAQAGLLGALLAATDPASIVPLFRVLRIRPRVARLAEGESGCNDAVSAVLLFALLSLVVHGQTPLLRSGLLLLRTVGGGIGAGLIVGGVAAWLLPGHRGVALFDTREQGAILSLCIVLGAYTLATVLGASGYMAVFVAGVVTANRHVLGLAPPPGHRRLHDAYLGQVGLLVRMLIFLVLGEVVRLGIVVRLALPALAVVAALMLVARPLAVGTCLGIDRLARWTRGEALFVSWVRETGVVPAALVGTLLRRGVPGASVMAGVVFVAVVVTIVVQVPTAAWWARTTGVASGTAGD